MKIILDTNIIVGACLGSRYDNLVIRGCLTGNFTPLVSHALLFEYEDLIGRESVFDHPVALIFTEREVLFNALYSVCRLIDVSYLWRPNLKDEGDNFIVELAVAGNADYKSWQCCENKKSGSQAAVGDAFLLALYQLNRHCGGLTPAYTKRSHAAF